MRFLEGDVAAWRSPWRQAPVVEVLRASLSLGSARDRSDALRIARLVVGRDMRGAMEYRRELKGGQAEVAVVVILGIVAYQCARRVQTVDDAARFAIGVSLTREYQGKGLREQVQEYLQQKASGGAPKEPPPSDVPIPRVELVSVKAHGSNDGMVAKVDLTVNGGPPPDGRSVRYLDLIRSVDGRWLVVAESGAYHYLTALLFPALPKPGSLTGWKRFWHFAGKPASRRHVLELICR